MKTKAIGLLIAALLAVGLIAVSPAEAQAQGAGCYYTYTYSNSVFSRADNAGSSCYSRVRSYRWVNGAARYRQSHWAMVSAQVYYSDGDAVFNWWPGYCDGKAQLKIGSTYSNWTCI